MQNSFFKNAFLITKNFFYKTNQKSGVTDSRMKFFIINILVILVTSSAALYAKGGLEEKQQADTGKNRQEAQHSNEQTKPKEEGEHKEEVVEPEKLLKVGNLSFPPSQQPSPLVSFGQNLLNKNQVQALFTANEFKVEKGYFINFLSSVLYGLRADLSILFTVPNAIRFRHRDHHSSGYEDLIVQFEYAPYTREYYTFYDQLTLVANVTIPTGSPDKDPPTGFGSNSFFFGGTFSRMHIDWFYFTSYGGIWSGSSHKTKFGDHYLYQAGLGRRIFNTSEWLFAALIEMAGLYSFRDKIHGVINRDSGGNLIFLIPSLFISSRENLIVQIGVGFPVHQRLFGHQPQNKYLLHTNVNWTF
jgi:hypothetical protein